MLLINNNKQTKDDVMKKIIIVAIMATLSTAAFAQKSMIRLDDCFGGTCSNLDFDMGGNDKDAAEDSSQNLQLNYAMTVQGPWAVGFRFGKKTQQTDGKNVTAGDSVDTIGLSVYWNKDGGFNDSCFAAFHYQTDTKEESDGADDALKDTHMTLEYGHRFTLGKLMGVNWNWSPSVSYRMTTASGDSATFNGNGDDLKSTSLSINPVNFAVTF